MNETLFFFHLLLIFAFGLIALKCGEYYLTAWIAIQAVLANLFVLKQVTFFHFHITCSDAYILGDILGLNLLQEYFGRQSAKRALWIAFFTLLFFTCMAQMHLLYTPSPHDTTQGSFMCILGSSVRLVAASLAVFFITQRMDIGLFCFLKKRCSFFPLSLRSALSTASTQCIDTLLFSFLGLWGKVYCLWDIIFISLLIKLLLICCLSFLLACAKHLIPLPKNSPL